MPHDAIIFSQHAFDQMIARFITEIEIRQVLEEGSVVEEYPDDLPYPGYLMLGFVNGRPLHVVASDNQFEKVTFVMTVYEPDRSRWDATFTRRKQT